jgi:hypothetical protein
VAHWLAVRQYALGDIHLQSYSFLAGASQYKRSLSTDSEELYWYVYRPMSRLIAFKKIIALVASRLGT